MNELQTHQLLMTITPWWHQTRFFFLQHLHFQKRALSALLLLISSEPPLHSCFIFKSTSNIRSEGKLILPTSECRQAQTKTLWSIGTTQCTLKKWVIQIPQSAYPSTAQQNTARAERKTSVFLSLIKQSIKRPPVRPPTSVWVSLCNWGNCPYRASWQRDTLYESLVFIFIALMNHWSCI